MHTPVFVQPFVSLLSRPSREWRLSKVFVGVMVVELALTIPCLALYGIADPDLYRSALWQEGWNHGWNSDPTEILYAYANYRPIRVPTPWNQFITNWNVVIAVLSMFILLVKSVMFVVELFPPLLSLIIHSVLTALYGISIAHQAGSDYSDPNHPSKVPWYLRRGCGAPVAPMLRGYCQQAQSSFAVAICMCAVFVAYISLSIFSLLRPASTSSKLTDIESPTTTFIGNEKWEMEMDNMSRSPGLKNPMTPRTLAFNTLDGTVAQPTMPNSGGKKLNRDLPLRHHISMGEEPFNGKEKGKGKGKGRWG